MPVKKTAAKKTVSRIKKAIKINPKDIPFQNLLLKVKDKITGDIRNLSDDNTGSGNDRSGDVSGHALHMADVATDMYDREFTLSLASNERELLYEVDEALMRIKEGTFGSCSQCKKPIPATRLKAVPYARTCLKCQEQIENKRR